MVAACHKQQLQVRMLGGGSNLLVREAEVPGLVLLLSAPAFCEIHVDGPRITAGGGAKLGHVISTSVREGLAGLEPLVGIPGTVGGALHNNAGTSGGDIGQHTHSARVMTRSGEICERGPDELRFAYRQSSLDELVILDATFELEKRDTVALTKRMQTLWIVKKASHPKGSQNVAALFKDPGVPAASLIEQAGLKGRSVGSVSVSDENANFLVAEPGCQQRRRLGAHSASAPARAGASGG